MYRWLAFKKIRVFDRSLNANLLDFEIEELGKWKQNEAPRNYHQVRRLAAKLHNNDIRAQGFPA